MREETIAQSIWQALESVMDPEIPVISLVEMGIIREIDISHSRISVTMTPTFSGCPALLEMETLIVEAGTWGGGIDSDIDVVVEKQLNPPWTSDWISDIGREKLKGFGLQPPARHGGNVTLTFFDVSPAPDVTPKIQASKIALAPPFAARFGSATTASSRSNSLNHYKLRF